MSAFTLEIVEGPGAGRQLALRDAITIGRAPDAGIVLDDLQASREHARVTPAGDGAIVEDLGSSNGTFINHAELHGPARLDPGDDLLIGVTVLQLRTERQIATVPSAVRPVPQGLAAAARTPDYVPAPVAAPRGDVAGLSALNSLLDTKVRRRTRTAPLGIFVLAAFVVLIFLATR